jgi:hypothetical protein
MRPPDDRPLDARLIIDTQLLRLAASATASMTMVRDAEKQNELAELDRFSQDSVASIA